MSDIVKRTVIEGGMIRVYEERVLHQAPLDAALSHIVTRIPVTITNVPKDTKHIAYYPTPNGLEASIVVEEFPSVHNIAYADRRGGVAKHYRLHMPFVYFTFRMQNPDPTGKGIWSLNDWRVFIADHIVKGVEEKLMPVCLPNTSSDGRTCEGSVEYRRSGTNELGDICQYVINTFWTSVFNPDMGVKFPHTYKTFEEWQEEGAKDPMSWQGWKKTWDKASTNGITFGTIFGGKVKFNDPIVLDGMIPSITPPYTYDQFDQWFNSMPKMAQEKFTANVMGHQQIHIKVPTRA